ncbi:hypothetical protein [Novosphingobium aerophilum]|uniref:Uncharacterized protein n=1 Tax=Novosphingobium aerophilum TaxID=2839843 RepID=A0A7X1F9P0_9SPHN|nr:hypothetical protein [Novosphingobium aerophilum]MBC2652529.1 hypothetical protein [Novosphingobium aerophilum]
MTLLLLILAVGAAALAVAALRRRTALAPGRLAMLAGLVPAVAIMGLLLAGMVARDGAARGDRLALMMIPFIGLAVALAGWTGGALALLLGRKP